MAVYAAGYVRTADAAQRFADESNERRRPVPDADAPSAAGIVSAGPTRDGRNADSTARNSVRNSSRSNDAHVIAANRPTVASPSTKPGLRPSKSIVPPTLSNATGAHAPPAGAGNANTSKAMSSNAIKPPTSAVAPVTTSASAGPTQSTNASVAPTQTVAAQSSTTVIAPPATTAQVPPVSSTAPVEPPKTNTGAPTAAPVAQTALKGAKWKDGTYSGWGTSRHGDIQASIENEADKIVYVAVTQCLTQYSCSWIAKLPQQVLDRQTPDVDSVSGATQSANAFYYAVVQALSKAK